MVESRRNLYAMMRVQMMEKTPNLFFFLFFFSLCKGCFCPFLQVRFLRALVRLPSLGFDSYQWMVVVGLFESLCHGDFSSCLFSSGLDPLGSGFSILQDWLACSAVGTIWSPTFFHALQFCFFLEKVFLVSLGSLGEKRKMWWIVFFLFGFFGLEFSFYPGLQDKFFIQTCWPKKALCLLASPFGVYMLSVHLFPDHLFSLCQD